MSRRKVQGVSASPTGIIVVACRSYVAQKHVANPKQKRTMTAACSRQSGCISCVYVTRKRDASFQSVYMHLKNTGMMNTMTNAHEHASTIDASLFRIHSSYFPTLHVGS